MPSPRTPLIALVAACCLVWAAGCRGHGDPPGLAAAPEAGAEPARALAPTGVADAAEAADPGAPVAAPPRVCEPGERRCAGMYPQRCDPSGQWQTGQACSKSATCRGGACVPWRPPPGAPPAGSAAAY